MQEMGAAREWRQMRIDPSDFSQITDPKKWVVVWPAEHKNGDLVYPYSAGK
jgi:hypothetical protein